MTEQIKDRDDYLQRLHSAFMFIVEHLEERMNEEGFLPHYEIHLDEAQTKTLLAIMDIKPKTEEESNANN